MIFVPALGHRPEGSVTDVAARAAAVLDTNDEDPKNVYSVESGEHDLRYGRTAKAARAEYAQVVRERPDGEAEAEPVIDLFEFEYSTTLFDRFDRKPAIVRGVRLLFSVLFNFAHLLSISTKGIRPKDKSLTVLGVMAGLGILIGLILFYWESSPRPGWSLWPILFSLILAGVFQCRIRSHRKGSQSSSRSRDTLWPTLAASGVAIVSVLMLDSTHITDRWHLAATIALVISAIVLIYRTIDDVTDDAGDRVQIAIALVALMIMGSYSIILLVGVGAAIWDVTSSQGDGSSLAAQDGTSSSESQEGTGTGKEGQAQTATGEGEAPRDALKAIALALTAAGITFAPKNVRERLGDVATRLLGVTEWLAMGRGRDEEIGRLYDLIEKLYETGYEEVVLVGYSFGSVIVLDAAFPVSAPPPTRMKKVGQVITIGCPAKTIARFWPHYWKERHCPQGKNAKERVWTNIYSPNDVLSAKFRRDENQPADNNGVDQGIGADAAAPWTITPRSPKAGDDKAPAGPAFEPKRELAFNVCPSAQGLHTWQKLMLAGIWAHSSYWKPSFDHDRGAVALFANSILADTNTVNQP